MMLDLIRVKLVIIIVLYKKKYIESVAIKSILNQTKALNDKNLDITIHVWNNSPDYSDPLKRDDVIWHSGNNDSLSSIYNRIARLAFRSGADLFMISDDDTDYSTYDFVNNITEIINVIRDPFSYNIGVFLPKIYACNVLVSPGKRFLFLGRLSHSVASGFNKSKNLLAINSGLVITKSCFEIMDPFYDSRIMFYATDTDFFVRYETYFEYVYVLNAAIDHDLSEYSSDTIDRALFRFEGMVKGFRIIFSRKGFIFKRVLEVYLWYAAVKKSLIYRSTRFFYLLMK